MGPDDSFPSRGATADPARKMTGALNRRELLLAGAASAGALALAGCGGGSGSGSPAADGSTLTSRWADPGGDGQLTVGPGEALMDRTTLGPAAASTGELARLAHLTDAHVLDASSPARVPFLARLGPPVQSTFRPHEALTAQVLSGTVNAIAALGPAAVIQGGDLIDNDQNNELIHALALLQGGRVSPGSGSHGYYGVQLPSDPDPFYYRPAIDAPRHPGMLNAAVRPFRSAGLGADWLPVLGDHDALVAGELVPNAETRGLALGGRALWELPTNLKLPDGFRLNSSNSPDGPPDPSFVSSFLAQALAGPTVPVPADPARYELGFEEVISRLWEGAAVARQSGVSAATRAAASQRLDYVRDVGDSLRIILLDLVRRGGGSGGLVSAGQPQWLAEQIAAAGERWIIVVTHFPLLNASGGEQLLSVMDRSPRVIAALAGHIHRNQIMARPTSAGGYWLITTASLIDYPQQARGLRLLSTAGGGVVLETWMLDHVGSGQLGTISRQLAYLDASGGRANGFGGTHADRNVRLFRRAVR
jgi:3',5'-cyclic AMP phosphodiesterase CpdA